MPTPQDGQTNSNNLLPILLDNWGKIGICYYEASIVRLIKKGNFCTRSLNWKVTDSVPTGCSEGAQRCLEGFKESCSLGLTIGHEIRRLLVVDLS